MRFVNVRFCGAIGLGDELLPYVYASDTRSQNEGFEHVERIKSFSVTCRWKLFTKMEFIR